MKVIFSLVFGFILMLNTSSQEWFQQQTNTNADLNSIFFADANLGWVVGSGGTILKTTNGGDQWVPVSSGVTSDLLSVHFTDPMTGFAVSFHELLKTTDGGEHWVIQDTVINAALSSVFFIGSDTGFVAGSGRILKTTDKGNTWVKQSGFGCFGVKSFWATDSQTLYMGGSDFLTIKSVDGGNQWDVLVPNLSYGNMESIFFTDNNTGYFAGGGWAQGYTGTYFAKTVDGGATMTNPLGNIGKWLSCVFFTDSRNGYITALDGSILKTTDAGDHWVSINSGVNSALTSIFFPDSIIGYVTGRSGTILKTTTAGLGVSGSDVPKKSARIYPNPVNDVLNIELNSLQQQRTSLQIYSVSGQLLVRQETLMNKTALETGTLPEGVYVLKIIDSQGTEVVKFDKR